MISDNGEVPAEEVLAPFLNGRGDSKQFTNISRSTKELRGEWFAKERQRVAILREDRPHADAERICFYSEGKLEIG